MKKQVRVCMLGSDLAVRGGMSTVVSQLLRHQWSRQVQIEYIPTHESGPVSHRCRAFLHGYLRLRRLLQQGQVDLVHLHMSQRGSFQRKYLLFRLAKRYRVKVILHLHGSEFMEYYTDAPAKTKARIRQLLRGCDRVLVLGRNWARKVRGIEPRSRLQILLNAVELPQETAQWNEFRREICYLGVLVPRKGVGDLLQALQILQRRGLQPPVYLTVAGSGEDLPRLEAMCRELGISAQVCFPGWIDHEEKAATLRHCQCFVLPSYHEGLPVCVLEALSYGVPTVSTDVGSVDEAVRDCENGRLVPPGDPEVLAEAIRWVISDRDRWKYLSRRARDTARQEFDERAVFTQLEQLYFDLTSEDKL